MSRPRQIIAVFLALLVLVTSSRAATLCVERNGSTRLEFVVETCCAEPTASTTAETTIASSQCSGCDDVPFRMTGRLVSQKSVSADLATKLLTFTVEPTALVVAETVCPTTRISLARDTSGQPPPRDARPARLLC